MKYLYIKKKGAKGNHTPFFNTVIKHKDMGKNTGCPRKDAFA